MPYRGDYQFPKNIQNLQQNLQTLKAQQTITMQNRWIWRGKKRAKNMDLLRERIELSTFALPYQRIAPRV